MKLKNLNFADEPSEIASTNRDKFKIVPLSNSIHAIVRHQVVTAERLYRNESLANPNGVPVPHAYARKCHSAPHGRSRA